MGFSLLGNSSAVQSLTEALQAGTLSHGYLFSGPSGSGKKTLAREFAAAAECTGGGFPCVSCSQCHKVLSGIHPDVIELSPEDGKQIPVDEIRRKICSDVSILPNEGKRKIYIITQAQAMNLQAQNAFLRTLEEPPSYVLFLLLSENPEGLLPTIRSRVTEIRLQPVSLADALPFLQARFPNAPVEVIKREYTLADGILGQAVASLEQQTSSVNMELLTLFCNVLQSHNELELFSFCLQIERFKRVEFSSFLQSVCLLFRDAASYKAGLSLQSAFPSLQQQLCSFLSLYQILSFLDLLEQFRLENDGFVSVSHLCGSLCSKGILILQHQA